VVPAQAPNSSLPPRDPAGSAAVTAPGRRELALAALLFLVAGAALFGPNVAHGGFVWDDWQNASNTHFSREPGLLGALDRATERPVFAYRPVLTTLIVLEHKGLGRDVHLHLAMAALFGALTAWALYLLLRTAGFGRLDSGVPAALLLSFPWTDSTRLWATAGYDTLAVALYLLGATLAVRALRAGAGGGGRRPRLLTAGSLVLYLAASWTYEVMTMAVLASVALYLALAPRRAALRRFALDAALVAVALAVVATGTTRDPQSLGDQLEHARVLASQSLSLLSRALVPVGAPLPGIVGAALAVAVAGASALAWRRLAPGDPRRPPLRRGLVAAAIGALFVVAGYALFVPALPHYQPLAPGTTNRMNVLAAAGYAVLVYSLVRLATLRLREPLAAVAAAVLCAAIGAGYVVQVARDEGDWQRSAQVRARVLAAIPRPEPYTTVYSFGAPTFVARGVPAFSLPFDLKAAVRLRFDNPSLAAYPVAGDTVIHCEAGRLYPTGGTYGRVHGARYGAALFVDVPARRAIAIGSRAACVAWRARLGAAPAG
jgi:hypothetical protein